VDANGTRYLTLLGRDDWGRCWRVAAGPAAAPGDEAASEPGADTPPEGSPLAEGWAGRSSAEALAVRGWDAVRHALMLPQKAFRFPAAPLDVPPDVASRRGAAGDRHGHIYWIDRDGRRILRQCAGDGHTEVFWPPEPVSRWTVGEQLEATRPPAPPAGPGHAAFGPASAPPAPPPLQLAGLAVMPDQRLVAGTLAPPGLLEFDLESAGPPRLHAWPAPPPGERPFEPCDLAAGATGLWVLDRPLPGADSPAVPVPARLWRLDPRLRSQALPAAEPEPPAPGGFHGDGEAPAPEPKHTPAIGFTQAQPLRARDPVAVEMLGDGAALVLDNPLAGEPGEAGRWSRLLHQPCSPGAVLQPLALDGLLESVDGASQSRFALRGQALLVLPPEPGDGAQAQARVLVVAQDGNQAFSFLLLHEATGPALTPLPAYLPMRLYRGRGLVAAAGRPWYDSRDTWVPLVAQRRPRHAERLVVLTPGGGAVGGEPLDSGLPGCRWHRVMVDGDLPPDTGLRLWARCADDPDALAQMPWREQPRPVARAVELPWLATTGRDGRSADQPGAAGEWHRFGTRDLLLQQADGRYLQLRLELQGNGLATPRLQALRVWFPRFGYSRYLPACWREDPAAQDFLDRLLAIAEGAFTAWEDRIATVQMLFDARTAPREALDWLATWLGLALDPRLDEGRRRLMLRHGHRLLRERGTLSGLQRMLRLVADPCSGDSLFTAPGPLPERPGDIRLVERPGGAAHQLLVRLPTRRGDTTLPARRVRTEQLLAALVPAHVAWAVDSYDTAFRLGSARIGFETLLGGQEPIAPAVVDQAHLGRARLAAPPELPRVTLDRDRVGALPPLT
jgi:phage tail-like protein